MSTKVVKISTIINICFHADIIRFKKTLIFCLTLISLPVTGLVHAFFLYTLNNLPLNKNKELYVRFIGVSFSFAASFIWGILYQFIALYPAPSRPGTGLLSIICC